MLVLLTTFNPLITDPEVVAVYVGVSVSGVFALIALIVSLRSLAIQKESGRAAVISAEAAQRANWLTEQRMLHEAASVTQNDAVTSEPVSGVGFGRLQEPDVRWSLDRKSKNAFVLRNVGTDVAEEVRIPAEGAAQISRGLPESATLRPRESVEFLMIGAMGAPVPNEILVTWKGRDPNDPLVLPVPG